MKVALTDLCCDLEVAEQRQGDQLFLEKDSMSPLLQLEGDLGLHC